MRENAPEAKVQRFAGGYLVRAAKLPPIGDLNSGAGDLGALPGVARFLKSKRVGLRRLRGTAVELDFQAWLARFDERANGAWENR